jgi:hypothetical protein
MNEEVSFFFNTNKKLMILRLSTFISC